MEKYTWFGGAQRGVTTHEGGGGKCHAPSGDVPNQPLHCTSATWVRAVHHPRIAGWCRGRSSAAGGSDDRLRRFRRTTEPRPPASRLASLSLRDRSGLIALLPPPPPRETTLNGHGSCTSGIESPHPAPTSPSRPQLRSGTPREGRRCGCGLGARRVPCSALHARCPGATQRGGGGGGRGAQGRSRRARPASRKFLVA